MRVDPYIIKKFDFKQKNADANMGLRETSLCIDAGDPDPSYNDWNGSRNDMGAHGGPCEE